MSEDIKYNQEIVKQTPLIDTHCHLNYKGIVENLDDVMKRAQEANIEKMVCISTNLDTVDSMIETVQKFDNVSFTIGDHPCNTYSDPKIHEKIYDDCKRLLIKYKEKLGDRLVGIGETGLDINNKNLQQQKEIFDAHLRLGAEFDLPIVVHSREMDEELLRSLKDHPNARGVLHCWTGQYETACKAIELGWKISFSGILTFGKKVAYLAEQARMLPIESIVVETDAPFLAPNPFRGKTNEPSYVRYTAQVLADLRHTGLEKISDQIYKNSCELFGL